MLSLVENYLPKHNNKGYSIRLFVSISKYLHLHQFICDQIDKLPGNKTTVSVDENNYIWIKNSTWSEVIGFDAAQTRLEETL